MSELKSIDNISLETDSAKSAAQSSSDWARTIYTLLQLAQDANQAFDYDRAIHYLNTIEEIWNSKGLPDFSLELRFSLHQEKGKALASLGKPEEACEEYQKILSFCRHASHQPLKAETFTQIGQLLAKQGDYDRALGFLQRSIGSYRRLSDSPGLCKALRNLGVVYVELGEFEEAELQYDEAIRVAQEIGDQLVYADLINNLGTIKNMKGSPDEALKLYRESLKIYQANKEIRKSAYAKNNIAITLSEGGDGKQAYKYFEAAHAIALEIKDASLCLIVDINLADLNLKKLDVSKAREHCDRALEHLQEHNLVNTNLVEAKKIAGKLAAIDRRFDEALMLLTEALEISIEIGAKYLEAEVLFERGILHRATQKHFESLTDLEASYHIYRDLKAEGKKEQTEESIQAIERLYLEIFQSMADQVDEKDTYTKGHSDRVAAFALLVGRELGLTTTGLKTVVAAGLLHDIGKLKIEDEVLKKDGKLTDDEFRMIQRHPEFGVEVLRGKSFPWDIKPLILSHHEKMDGTGYPFGLKGEDIPLGARLLCVVDVFDALTSDRVYRKAFSVEKALSIMEEEMGTAFDSVILRCFARMIRDGKGDVIINARTSKDEIYNIWSECMSEVDKTDLPAPPSAVPTI